MRQGEVPLSQEMPWFPGGEVEEAEHRDPPLPLPTEHRDLRAVLGVGQGALGLYSFAL